ncbi:MAG: FAD-dependent oxidoreductase [Clostridia bacterium]|nr:FAD-dependent oxidoreductase [Clostridia bacterium]
MSKNLSRRNFLKLAGVSTLAAASMGAVSAVAESAVAYDQLVAWDGEYDVVVIGMGMAGMTAAINAANEGANVLILEKAPEGEAGGNSRVCHQLYGTINNVEEGMKYYSAMRGNFTSTSDAVLRAYVEGMSKLDDYLVTLGANRDTITSWVDCGIPTYEVEHPELPGGSAYEGHSIVPKLVNGALFNLNKDYMVAMSDKIDVWYSSPARRLIQDPASRTILGVTTETEAGMLNIRAKNGVILCCGGFENNKDMVESYLGIGGNWTFYGSAYNTGDGVTMAMDVGAKLWHMHNYESTGVGGNVYYGASVAALFNLTMAPSILVGPDGTRYCRESMYPSQMRHGHIYVAGDWTFPAYVEDSWSIVTAGGVEASAATEIFEAGVVAGNIVKADTIEELAEMTGMTYLAETVAIYNRYCENKLDEAFRRPEHTLLPLLEGPYYAVKMDCRGILNTQGGPERNENAEVLDVFNKPIPHLYSAGELGGVTAHDYQGGGNIAECLVFGQIAGKNAATAKDALPPFNTEVVASSLKYTKGVRNDLTKAAKTAADYEAGENQYVGIGHGGMGGDIAVRATVVDGKIEAIEVLEHSETAGISDPAFAQIPAKVIETNSTDVDTVSGCTMTSKALIEAIKNAVAAAM